MKIIRGKKHFPLVAFAFCIIFSNKVNIYAEKNEDAHQEECSGLKEEFDFLYNDAESHPALSSNSNVLEGNIHMRNKSGKEVMEIVEKMNLTLKALNKKHTNFLNSIPILNEKMDFFIKCVTNCA